MNHTRLGCNSPTLAPEELGPPGANNLAALGPLLLCLSPEAAGQWAELTGPQSACVDCPAFVLLQDSQGRQKDMGGGVGT
jgi:hypothetical protein